MGGYASGRAVRDATANRYAAIVPWCRITTYDGKPEEKPIVIEPTAPARDDMMSALSAP
jgi:hypothetical protein